jgi:hypothetical protein
VAPVLATVREGSANMLKACWGTLPVLLEVLDVTTVLALLSDSVSETAAGKGVGYDDVEKAITHFNYFNS